MPLAGSASHPDLSLAPGIGPTSRRVVWFGKTLLVTLEPFHLPSAQGDSLMVPPTVLVCLGLGFPREGDFHCDSQGSPGQTGTSWSLYCY